MPEKLREIQSALLDDLYDRMLVHLEVGLQLGHDALAGREKPVSATVNLKAACQWLLRIMAVNKEPQRYIEEHLSLNGTAEIDALEWPADTELLRDVFQQHYTTKVPDLYSYLLLADGGLQLNDDTETVSRQVYLNLSLTALLIETGALLPHTYIETHPDKEFLLHYPQWRIMRLDRWVKQAPAKPGITVLPGNESVKLTCLCGNEEARLYFALRPYLMDCKACNRYFFDRQELQLAGISYLSASVYQPTAHR